MIGPENSHHSLNQSDAKLKPIMNRSLAFSRALGKFGWFYLKFLLALNSTFLSSDRPLWLLWFLFYDAQSKGALVANKGKNRALSPPFEMELQTFGFRAPTL